MKKKYYGNQGARHFAKAFYASGLWRNKSESFRNTHPLCERCLKKGLYEPSTCVHHKIHISVENYQDPAILYGDDNLEALCDKCHYVEHHGSTIEYDFNEDGSLILDYEEEGEY